MGFGGGSFMGMKDLSLGQAMFMGEEEGQSDMVDTPQARFNAAIYEIEQAFAWAKGTDLDITSQVNDILWQHGINPNRLTQKQVNRIEVAIN